MSYETASTSDEGIQIGSAVAAKIELTVKRINELFENTEIPIEIGLKLPSGKYEYIPLGFFTAEHPTLDQATTTFTAYDRMMKTTGVYVSELTYPASAESVLKEISNGCGVPCNVSGLNGITIDTAPVGYTYREVIGYIASLAGGFACVDRTGTIVIKWYEDNGYTINESRIMTFEKNESDYHLDYLTCNVDSNTSFTSGIGTLGITFDNPLMTEEKLNSVHKKVRGFAYRGASLKTLGDIRLDPWDIVTVEESGETYKIPVMNITQEYDGGLAMTITAYGKTETETETDYKGPSAKLAERIYAEMMLTKELVAKKVDAEWVKANTVQAETVVAINNELENIRNNYLKSNIAEIKYATIESLKGVSGEFEQFKTNDFTAIIGKVNDLTVGVEKVNTLMFGSASGGSLTTEFSNSVISLIGDAQIKSAMIESIDAKKITSLDVNTTSVNIHSESGLSRWKDNTIVISDGTRTRVQIGKDANADYNMYVWDKAGNLMFDALGLTEKGVKREIIRNDMVKEDANISAGKLDIASLFDVINNDGSHTLKSSKIYVDSDKQTLDVSFKSITTKTDTAVTAANKAEQNAGMALSTANSADTKAQSVLNRANAGEFKGNKGDKGDTGATGKGVLSITPQYYLSTSNTTQSGGSWSNTRPSWVAGRYYWTRDYIQWTDGSVTASTPQLATDLNNLYSSLQTVTNTVSSQGTQLSTVQGQISSKVWQQDITTAVTNLQIGGRNLFQQSGHWTTLPDAKYWYSNGGGITLDTSTKYLGYNTVKTIVGSGIVGYRNDWLELDINKTYTYSAMVKTSVACNGASTVPIHYHCSTDKSGPNGSIDIFAYSQNAPANKWTLLYITFKPKAKYFRPFIYIGGSYNITFNIAYLKLEEGNKATDWTPAPEDIDANISSVEGKITTVSNQYTILNQSFTSLKATVNSNTTAISKKADNSTVTEINNRVTTLTADLSGIKQSISATYVTKTEYAKEIDWLGDNINNVDDKASAAQDWCQTIEDNITDHYSTTVQMNNAITQAVSAESNSIKLEVSGTYATKNDINNLQIGGVNRFIKSTATINKYITATGTITAGGNYWDLTDYIDVSQWTHYIASGWTNLGNAPATCFYDSNKKFISGVAGNNTSARHSLPIPTGAAYMRFSYAHVDTDKLKIEKGTKATDYSPAPEDVNAKFNNYATTASLSAYIAKTDTGALKSCIEAIADDINLTAGGSINISGNKSVNIRGNTFSLDSSGTKISNTGYLQTVNAKLGEWNVDSKAIYCETADKVYTAYLQNPDYVVGNIREDAWVYSVQKNGIATFYVTSEGDLYCRCFSTPYTTYQPNYRWATYENSLNTTLFIRTFHGPCLIIANVSIWTDDTSDYGTIKCGLYLDGYCVTENQHRLETTNAIELSAGATYVWYFSDNEAHTLSGIGGSTKNGKKTITYSVQALFNNDVGWGTGQ
jgi:phage host-nuclease inhibitor protein Gam